MNIEPLIPKLPLLRTWIEDLLKRHAAESKPLAHYAPQRISAYFPKQTLDSVRVVKVPKLPIPPLSALGLSQFADFENGDYAAITYLNTYFMVDGVIRNEGVHFHEIVHTVQWTHLGVDRFILAYAIGLMQFGYVDSPLEVMARKYEQKFQTGTLFSAEDEIIAELNKTIIPTLPKLS